MDEQQWFVAIKRSDFVLVTKNDGTLIFGKVTCTHGGIVDLVDVNDDHFLQASECKHFDLAQGIDPEKANAWIGVTFKTVDEARRRLHTLRNLTTIMI